MRIIAGKAGRRRIQVPKEVTRPTTDFVRQALFSVLGARLEAAAVLDLFAGSGALGLEALSRGAKSCVFVEEHAGALKVLRENLRKSGLEGAQVVRGDVAGWIRGARGGFDLVFADPPYARAGETDHLAALAEAGDWEQLLNPGGILIFEQEAEGRERDVPGLICLDRRTYGGTAILLYGREGDF